MFRSFFILCILILPIESIGSIWPPYDRGDGIEGCIKTLHPDQPGDFTAYLLNMCAEPSSANTYKTPKIRVRSQNCNFAACWGKSTDLVGNGECVLWPGPYGMPLTRICARIAVSADPITSTPADDGYTPRKHLAYEGEHLIQVTDGLQSVDRERTKTYSSLAASGTTVKDEPMIGSDGTPFYLDSPKICAYHDPWMLEHVIPNPFFDPMDYNPLKQPMHTGSGVSPIAQLIINLVKFGEDILLSPMSIARVAAGMKSGVLESIVEFIPKVVTFVGKNTFIALLEEFGQFNRVVYSRLGCANLKLGYFPPPYCPSTVALPPSGTVTMICPNGVSPGNVSCVPSSTTNNAINNTVRVGFDKMIPICKPEEMGTDGIPIRDTCVTLNPPSMQASAVAANHTLPKCTEATTTGCVNTKLKSVSNNLRIVYGEQYGKTVIPKPYYNKLTTNTPATTGPLQFPDCTATLTTSCQTIWGVNAGSFADISLTFPHSASDVATSRALISPKQSVNDPSGARHNFYAAITTTDASNPVPPYDQLPSDICVYASANNLTSVSDTLVGCVHRALPPKPTLYQCGAPSPAGIKPSDWPSCTESITSSDNANPNATTSTNTSPLMIVLLKDGTDYISGTVGVASTKNTSTPTSLNLAGVKYSAYATDESYKKLPFTAQYPQQNASTLYGQYIAGPSGVTTPVNANGARTDAIYLNGMEYISQNNGSKYKIYGTQLCLTGYNADPCPSNPKNCVLTNLLNANITPCSAFLAKISSSAYPGGVTRCATTEGCTVVESITPQASGTLTYHQDPVKIMKCTVEQSTQYCYSHSSNKDLCKTSYDAQNREHPKPPPECREVLSSGDNGPTCAYYEGSSFNADLYTLRSKTAVEQNLCVHIPELPKCAAITTADDSSGNATWPETKPGELATGKCEAGRALQRYCLIDQNTLTSTFQPLTNNAKCITDRLYAGEGGFLRPGDALFSKSNKYKLHYQENGGDLTIVKMNTTLERSISYTNGQAAGTVQMQGDGNLVIYNPGPIWSTGTQGNPKSVLIIGDDGNAAIYALDSTGAVTTKVLWKSAIQW